LRRFLTASVALIALATAASTAFGAKSASEGRQSIGRAAMTYYGGEIARFERETWHWQRVMGVRLTPRSDRTLSGLTPTAVQQAEELWRHRLARTYAQAQHPPHLHQFLCIHHFEGSWTDTGSPFYGGLQMDRTFQESYGGWLFRRKGTADHWSPLEQIWTAEKALKSRGFWPWPNTARYCGLI
jgi:hypothetical protein